MLPVKDCACVEPRLPDKPRQECHCGGVMKRLPSGQASVSPKLRALSSKLTLSAYVVFPGNVGEADTLRDLVANWSLQPKVAQMQHSRYVL